MLATATTTTAFTLPLSFCLFLLWTSSVYALGAYGLSLLTPKFRFTLLWLACFFGSSALVQSGVTGVLELHIPGAFGRWLAEGKRAFLLLNLLTFFPAIGLLLSDALAWRLTPWIRFNGNPPQGTSATETTPEASMSRSGEA